MKIFKSSTILLFIAFALVGCGTVKQMAIKQVGDALAGEKAMLVISSDDDPELVWDAMPFALKTMEIMLAQDPDNQKLANATAAAFVQYALGHLGPKARQVEYTDYEKSQKLLKRAKKLSLRGYRYAFPTPLTPSNMKSALESMTKDDLPKLYWGALGLAGAIAADKNDMNLMAQLPIAEAMMKRALELDEGYQDGGIHEFFIAYEGSRPKASGGSPEKAEKHFKRAVELSNGQKASPYVILAEKVAVKQQNLAKFKHLLDQAEKIDEDQVKKWRLANIIAKDKAKWLRSKIPDLFLDAE